MGPHGPGKVPVVLGLEERNRGGIPGRWGADSKV